MSLGYKLLISVFSFLLLWSCKTSPATKTLSNNSVINASAPNVIFMIGDGMGLSQVSSLWFSDLDTNHFASCNNVGLVQTSSASEKITDSAAGATAYATGKRTYNGAISVGLQKQVLPTLLEQLSSQGYQSGVIATSTITHATPACFYAHVDYRKKEANIAEQLVTSEVDFFAGGGLKYFQNREDGQNLIDSLQLNGFNIGLEKLPENVDASLGKYGYLLADEGMPRILDGRGDYLSIATSLALDYFSQSKDPFFLMVEGSQIDWGGHKNDGEYIVSEAEDFNQTLGVVLEYLRSNPNTIVVVTADHETGGFSLVAQEDTIGVSINRDYNQIRYGFSSGGHSATMVPLFAYGVQAEMFCGVYENIKVYEKIKKIAMLDSLQHR